MSAVWRGAALLLTLLYGVQCTGDLGAFLGAEDRAPCHGYEPPEHEHEDLHGDPGGVDGPAGGSCGAMNFGSMPATMSDASAT